MEALDKDVREAIEKNMPSVTAGILKKYLEEAEKTKGELATLKSTHEDTTEKLDKSLIECLDLKKQLAEHKSLGVREQVVSARENKLEIELLKKDIACEKAGRESVYNLVDRLFRNTEFRKTSFGNAAAGCGGGPTGPGYIGTVAVNDTVTKEHV